MKGPSWLSCLNSFKIVEEFSPDYMHGALLGVTKLLINLWTAPSKCRGTDHDLHSVVDLLDERIQQMKIPSEIRRSPRGIKDVKHWKGTYIMHACMHVLIYTQSP